MKLAQALLVRGENQKQIKSLTERIHQNARVQEGDQPEESPAQLLETACALLDKQHTIVQAIQKANMAVPPNGGASLAETLATRKILEEKHALLKGAISASRSETDRYSMREIKWNSTLDVAGLQKQADHIASDIRKINMALQQLNWELEVPLPDGDHL